MPTDTAQFALGVKGAKCHFRCMSRWITSLPNADRPVWRGRNFIWYMAASFASFRALAAARWHLRTLLPRDVMQANERAASDGIAAGQLGPDALEFAGQMRRIIPRISRWCPFRSDCLVQAIAGQHLLSRRNIASRIVLAAEQGRPEKFQPHALLMVGNMAVTGGDPAQFTAIYGDIAPGEGGQ